MRERLVKAFPKEERAIDRYMALCSYISFLPAGAYFITKLLPRWVGTLLAPVVHLLFHRWSDRTVTEVRPLERRGGVRGMRQWVRVCVGIPERR